MVWVMPSSAAVRGDPPRLTLWCRVHVHVGWRANSGQCRRQRGVSARAGRTCIFSFSIRFQLLTFCVCVPVCVKGGRGVIHFNQRVVFPESLVRLDLSLGISWVFGCVARACGSLCMGMR
ncbi:unnamed protein product [Ectocarpus sp. 8 AP-2014]